MSRIGKLPVPIEKGVDVKIDGNRVVVKGPKGQLEQEVTEGIAVRQEDSQLLVEITGEGSLSKFQGLFRALINNMVIGVTKGFEKKLELIGVGYRASVAGTKLDLQVGYSHPVALDIPNGLNVKVEKNTLIVVEGCDKQAVGQFAAAVRAKRKPEPYKGKGIRYQGEYVRKKAGKAGRAAKV